MNMDMSKYLDVFLEESQEHLQVLNEKLLELEKTKENPSAIDAVFRSAHTLKGMSSTMGFEDLADLTHHMENVLSDLKDGLLEANSFVIDALFQCLDRIQVMIENIELEEKSNLDNSDLIKVLQNIKAGDIEAAAVIEKETKEESGKESKKLNIQESELDLNDYDITIFREAATLNFNTFYIKAKVDEKCLMKSVRTFMVFKAIEEDGEIVKSIPSAQDLDEGKFDTEFQLFVITSTSIDVLMDRINKISEIEVIAINDINVSLLEASSKAIPRNNTFEEKEANDFEAVSNKSNRTKQTVRVDIDRLDNLMNLVGELVMHKGRLEQIGANKRVPDLNETIEQIDRVSADLQSVVMKVRMVPIEQVFNRFPRMVRDLAKELNKDVDFIVEGKETELDRTVIDEIGDPLVHILRNAVDHGLEPPEVRVEKGKSISGTIWLKAKHEGNHVYIEVEDDGKGINHEKILRKAIEKDIITQSEATQLKNEEIVNLLFSSGFSTAEDITDISGRGVGLDVVRSKIEALNGEIFLESVAGRGTKFKIKLPLTLAIIQALMVSIKEEIYAIPLSSVDETTLITKNDIKMIQNQEVVMLRGHVLPLYRLGDLLEVPNIETNDDEMYVVVVRKADKQIGLAVDTLIGQQEIVIKSLGKVLAGIPGLAGAIVSGDGNVRLILDITTLI
ncbi:Signal transduction histidine kinase CheA [Candidatus Syntrophocurvum alkaliphilum]|uniref:Chemotaxis protein CheA n=1 Tax=Candidatus Syntrophocurvum alkaliphilum TaxID=2293317 RepID=A0A6I6DFG0_9FIRM|nr:chemotaxis protein CheA [Candidatus Syntrophocurvum alkaliphilum]QGT99188.1 Signal transduction histidine kinase CheA [Candidatus Syntrophocurvum alkaliphilum]